MQPPPGPRVPRVRARVEGGPARVLESANAGGVRLLWHGREWQPHRENGEEDAGVWPRITPTEVLGDVSGEMAGQSAAVVPARGGFAGRLVHGDALDVARAMRVEGLAGKVDLVYVDPPFASPATDVHAPRLDGRADGRVVRAPAYDDRWHGDGLGPYLDMLAPRLDALAGLLAPTGTIWVHVDWRASYLVRALLDEVMGRGAFVNEIVWRRAPNLGRQAASHQFGRTLDTIVVYGRERVKLAPPTRLEPIEPGAVRIDGEGRPFTTAPRGDYTDESIARLEALGRIHRTASGKVYVKYFLVKNADGTHCRERRVDALWTDVAPLRHSRIGERTGFPTQKPRALLDRIIECACPVGGLVVDLFGGSGTTGESAHGLGRRFVVGDAAPLAIGTARARLLRAGAAFIVESCGPPRAVGADAPEVEFRVEAVDERIRVELLAPREPLAWAIDVTHDPARPFRTAWHSERSPGVRACAVAREAVLDRGAGLLAVRVWSDDGGTATRVVEAP